MKKVSKSICEEMAEKASTIKPILSLIEVDLDMNGKKLSIYLSNN